MSTELGRKREELSEIFNKDLENIRKDKLELKNTIRKMKNTLEESTAYYMIQKN